jgi:triosephosphate isomerase
MNKLFIVANLKSYKTESEAKQWLEDFKIGLNQINFSGEKEIIICPSFTLLHLFKNFLQDNNLPVKLGAQNISPFSEGAYTGEVNAKQIKEFADYVLIGHSERRKNFNEEDEVLMQKTKLSLENELSVIYCVQEGQTNVPSGVNVLAYEPVFAIGSGNPDTPENANKVAGELKEKNDQFIVLYGGSVNSENVNSFTKQENILGVLVGGASLEAKEFVQIIKNA